MAPTNKRSSTPTRQPSWVSELLIEINRLHNELHHQGATMDQIHTICLSNQRAVHQRTSNIHVSATRSKATNAIAGHDPLNAVRTSRTTSRGRKLPVKIHGDLSQRISKPIERDCWYHKQFGAASISCIPPCSFIAPVIPVVPVDKPKKRPTIHPAGPLVPTPPIIQKMDNPAQDPPSPMEISIPEPIASTSKGLLPTDWNLSESSSSSDSDSSSSSDSSSKSTPKWRKTE